MTSNLIYANRGRKLIWLGAGANLYIEATDDELTVGDAQALGLFAVSTVALFIPDPEATALGWGATRFLQAAVSGVNSIFSRASVFWWTRTLAQKSAITYIAFTPILLAAAQKEKETLGVEDWDAALGDAMWQAQSDPTGTGEQLNINITSSPLGGSLPF